MMEASGIIKFKSFCTIVFLAFDFMYVILKQSNPPLLDWNSRFVLGGISSFDLQTTTIANFKPHGSLDSSTVDFDGTTFCSPIVGYDEATFCF